jgi:N6-adenosine-specific RNA methylase IME4
MSIRDIAALPVTEWCAKDCVLFLWTTDSMLRAACDIIDSWGFIYKTVAFTWAKSSLDGRKWPIGLGFWTRSNPEMCLLATRGKPKSRSRAVRQLIIAPRRAHSQKPEETYERIETLCAGPYLEMFARQRREGWDAWGTEVDSGIGARRWHS